MKKRLKATVAALWKLASNGPTHINELGRSKAQWSKHLRHDGVVNYNKDAEVVTLTSFGKLELAVSKYNDNGEIKTQKERIINCLKPFPPGLPIPIIALSTNIPPQEISSRLTDRKTGLLKFGIVEKDESVNPPYYRYIAKNNNTKDQLINIIKSAKSNGLSWDTLEEIQEVVENCQEFVTV